MSILALLLLLVVLSGTLVALGWKKNDPVPEILWEPRAFAASYTSVIGPLAAFSVASAIFMAGVSVNRQTPAFQTMIGMLLIAYIVFTGTAMMFASTPGRPSPSKGDDENFERLQRFSIAIAMLGYGVGVSIAWLTLRPLLVAIELAELANTFVWVLLVTTIAACARWVLFLYRLFETRRFVASLMPVLGLGFASAYYLILRHAFPQLWPSSNAPLTIAMILFGIVLLGFATHSMMLSSYGSDEFNAVLAKHGHRITLAYYSAATGALFLLWFAVSFAPGSA
jgi:hypothetical protein